MQIELDRSSREPLYRQLAGTLQQRIRSGALPPRTRLPTVRQLARQLGVTRLTIHSAYAELQSGGWIEATVGRGTFVAERIEQLIAPLESQIGREATPAGVLSDLLRMAQIPGIIALSRADPAHEFFPLRNWQRASEMAFAQGGSLLMNYSTPQGDQRLRSTLAELVRERGISSGPDEVMVTAGVSGGMALCADVLARPGDMVIVEQPTYLGLLNILAARGIRAVGVPMDEDGMQIEALEAQIAIERPAFIYTIPTFHNPGGVCLSATRRAQLLEIAARQRIPVVEDDIYGRISFEGPAAPALKANDSGGHVIYLSSFSKSLMPGLRLGYIVAAPELIQRFAARRQAIDICSPPITQRALALFIEQGWLHSHIRRMLPRYRERRDAMLSAMEHSFPLGVTWTRPRGGFACWVSLPTAISITDLYVSAVGRGVAFVPGEIFGAAANGRSQLRLCYSAEPPERISEAIELLGMLLRDRSHGRLPPHTTPGDYMPVI